MFHNKYAVTDGGIPLSNEQLNYWLGSKDLQRGEKGGQGKWAHEFYFVSLRSRSQSDEQASSFLNIDEEGLGNKVEDMLISCDLSKGEIKDLSSVVYRFNSNNLTEDIKKEIDALKKNKKMKSFINPYTKPRKPSAKKVKDSAM